MANNDVAYKIDTEELAQMVAATAMILSGGILDGYKEGELIINYEVKLDFRNRVLYIEEDRIERDTVKYYALVGLAAENKFEVDSFNVV